MEKKDHFEFSEKGRDFDGRELNENTLDESLMVQYGDAFYTTGNRRNNIVELYDAESGELKHLADCKDVQLVKLVVYTP